MKGKMHGKKAGGGSVEEGRDLEKEDKTPSVVYAGKDSDVVKEASKRKKGGVCKKRGGAVDGGTGLPSAVCGSMSSTRVPSGS